MSADFWAGYASGAVGILIGNPLDLIKTRIQSGTARSRHHTRGPTTAPTPSPRYFDRWPALARGAAAPILGYGALNALLFVSYHRSLAVLHPGASGATAERPSGWSVWAAGAAAGLAIFVVSAPTELVKCRAQVGEPPRASLAVARELWRRRGGVRGLYGGGGVTAVRDAVGYGFYFWSYELSKRALAHEHDTRGQEALKTLLCGGLAGVMTWASIFPLDVVKTRVQTWDLMLHSRQPTNAARPLLNLSHHQSAGEGGAAAAAARPSTFHVARQAYLAEGAGVFFRGLGICSARAFIVNAVQWAVYEWMMKVLAI